ncbi:MAG: TetR/AcrR family transcriptional regulator, partial [Actinomycetes bacterium]
MDPEPTRTRGTRVRAGNAMGRVRSAILSAAEQVLRDDGVDALTMRRLAEAAGVARATLYNHFRRREDVLVAVGAQVVERARQELVAGCPPETVSAAAVAAIADQVAEHPLVAGLRRSSPGSVQGLGVPGAGLVWDGARRSVAALLGSTDAQTELVLRWLASLLVDPGTEADRCAGAALLAGGLAAAQTGDRR